MTPAGYRAAHGRKQRHKFNAKPVEHDGIRFDSKKEGNYYLRLKLLVKAGEVVGFFRQVPLHLTGGVIYRMDFLVFYSNGECRGVEIKGFETPEWKIKKKMIAELYPWFDLDVVK